MLSFNTITNSIDESVAKDVKTRKNVVNKVLTNNFNLKYTSLENRIAAKNTKNKLNDFKSEQQNIYWKK